MTTPPHKQLITLPLQTLVDLSLRDNHDVDIPRSIADLIYAITKNEHTCYIQFTDRENITLDVPRLWNLHQWRISTESWIRSKDASHKRKVQDWLLTANVDMVEKAINRKWQGISGGPSRVIAYQLVKSRNMAGLKEFGINKLKETEEEL